MKNTMKRTQRTEEKKSGSRALVFALLVAMMIALFPQKNQAFAAEREAIGTGTLNANWVNLGLNWYMTGGTSGRVVRGESFIVYEKKTVNQTNRYYVYAENAGIYGYISERFLNFTPAEKEVIGYGTLNGSWVNLGLNWYMTGGTSGRVVKGESFVVYAKKCVNNTNRYYVYAKNAGIYGYISERFLNFTPAETVTAKGEDSIVLDVALHVQETTTTCGVASAKMVLDYLNIKTASGKKITETELWNYANSNGHGTYVYRIAQTLTQYGASYDYVSMSSASAENYWNVIKSSLEKNRPVILPIKPTKNSYWSYNTGHYIVVTGMYVDSNGVKQVIINDCHFRYSAEDKVVPLTELVRVSKNHSGYLIVGE